MKRHSGSVDAIAGPTRRTIAMHQDVDGTDEDEMDDHRAWRCTVAHIDLDVSD